MSEPFYFAKPTEIRAPGEWGRTDVEIWCRQDGNEAKIGEYVYNYPSFGNTFCPFKKGGEWYALYSKHYTASRIMKLPSCEDIGGEEMDGRGFCPVHFFVPAYQKWKMLHDYNAGKKVDPYWQNYVSTLDWNEDGSPKVREKEDEESVWYPEIYYYPFGFVAGCVWGDDTSWKIQYLDLSEADKGVLKRDSRFGYIQMPSKIKNLRDCIEIIEFDDENVDRLNIAHEECFHIGGQKFDDWWDMTEGRSRKGVAS